MDEATQLVLIRCLSGWLFHGIVGGGSALLLLSSSLQCFPSLPQYPSVPQHSWLGSRKASSQTQWPWALLVLRLQRSFGIRGIALAWFISYLSNRTYCVFHGGVFSSDLCHVFCASGLCAGSASVSSVYSWARC